MMYYGFMCCDGELPSSLCAFRLHPHLNSRFARLLSPRESGMDEHAQTQDPEDEAANAPENRADQSDESSHDGTERCPDRGFRNRATEGNPAEERPCCDWGEHDSDASAEQRAHFEDERIDGSSRMGIAREHEPADNERAEDSTNDDASESKASGHRDDSARSGQVHR
jgi:hypothetical protein